ncbi:hypothetical protein SLS62_007321 [Diatrype stigma]|uniref:DSBA-like thioredoxin domain-containing protein n=1 Tax=Diatrype stigma TaxID=117547 RepID=A0AAN9YQW4_9PEZI
MISIQDLLLPDEDPLAHHQRYHEGMEAKRYPEGIDLASTARITTHFQIEFILDTICPHCYIGLKNLTIAMQIHQERHPEDTFEVTFSPVMLSRGTSRSAYDKETFYHSFGWSPSQLGQWTDLGAAAGVAFSWRGRTGNSRDSHKLLRFALEDTPSTMRSTAFTQQQQKQQPGSQPQPLPKPQPRGPDLQLRLAHAVLRGYFEEDRDVSDRGFLAEVGAAVTGYPAAAILRACLLDDDDEDEDGGGDGIGDEGNNRKHRGWYQDDRRRCGRNERNGVRKAKAKAKMRRKNNDGDGGDGDKDTVQGLALREGGDNADADDNDDSGNNDIGGPWGRAVDALEADVRARGIDAVPTIIVQDRYLAGGWQEARLLVELFESIRDGGGGRETTTTTTAASASPASASTLSSPLATPPGAAAAGPKCWLDGCGGPRK